MSPRILAFLRYGRLGASSRLRTLQYLPFLEREGIQVDTTPLFDDDYLVRLYENRRVEAGVLRAYFRRVRSLRASRDVDILLIEKEALPWVPWPVERALMRRGIPVVTDYDDALFHRYDLHRWPVVRQQLGRKIDSVMAASALVMAGNAYLADRARAAGAMRVEIVPTVVDITKYSVTPNATVGTEARIGWIGTPITWNEFMGPMMPILAGVADERGARVMAVGAGDAAAHHPLLDILPWTEETEVALIQQMDIGIMPLTDTPWARGKCGYKLVQYMACGLPVVASPVGVNTKIIEHGVNGFFASTETEWRGAIDALLSDPDLRRRMGAEGRRKVEVEYSLQVWGPRVARMLLEVTKTEQSGSI